MKNKVIAGVIAAVVLLLGWAAWAKAGNKAAADSSTKIVYLKRGDIQTVISTTGTILPKSRLEMHPAVGGRIERVLAQEGQHVKVGEIVAVMSSTDRAALLDAARGQGEAAFKYWQDVYKPIPLTAPIDGEVIVGTIQPGQAVSTADAVLVLSDRLIVRAQVDETDIGKVKPGQEAIVGLDAYPDVRIEAVVDHIYYESRTVNNVTVYLVDLIPATIPDFVRSGMSANVDLVQERKTGVLTLPLTAVQKENGESYVLVPGSGKEPVKQPVMVGLADEKRVEILSGLSDGDEVVVKSKKYTLPKGGRGTNPFAPARPVNSRAAPRS
jgi:macrolide-specific efflux system membrane fusion protein